MAEYIERGVAIALASGGCHPANVAKEIAQLPAADVRPVVRGEWLEEINRTRSYKFVCSACCKTAYDPQPTRVVGWVKRCRYAFCPNCGAVMKVGGR